MKRKWKILIGIFVVLAIGGGVFASVQYQKRGITTVQTGKVVRQDLTSLVTASGEIKPRNYISIGANAQGRIIGIYVKEGDHVRKNQLLARLESIQAEADVQAQKAAVNSAESDSAAAEASLKSADEAISNAKATLERNKADLERTQSDFRRAEELWKNKLIARSDYEIKKAANDVQIAAVREAETHVSQTIAQRNQLNAQLASAQRHITQSQAVLRRTSDVLDKYSAVAPIDGVVTNLPVRVGETVVPGVTNLVGSNLMTIADTSIITAEVKVDETDIVSVKLGQTADVTVDAVPNKTFHGKVIEIGNTAIVRSTGVAASASTTSSQEAKDFKVVIALENPPDELRPGLSCTSKITTASRARTLTIPIQALTVRQKGDLEPEAKPGTASAASANPNDKTRKEEIQGVFVVNGPKAEFRKVDTGITGSTDIEVTSGLKEGDEIITGSYKVIRTLRNEAKVKVDNKPPEKKDTPST